MIITENIAKMQNGVVGYTYKTTALEIDNEIETKWQDYLGNDWATNGYLMIVGGDDIIPFFREKNPGNVDDDPFIASDDNYSDMNGDKYVDLATGRIVGNIDLMMKQLTTEYAGGDDVMILAGDFLINGAQYVKDKYDEHNYITEDGAIVDYGDSCGSTCNTFADSNDVALHNAIINNEISDKDIIYYGYHASYNGWGHCWCGSAPILKVNEIDVIMNGSFVYSLGCHNGQIVDFYERDMNINNNMPLRFLYEGSSNFLGNSGYGYGGTSKKHWDYVTYEWSEALLAYFTENILNGQDFGTALKNAKRTYREQQYDDGFNDNYDKKVILELILYGNPKNGLEAAEGDASGSPANTASAEDMKNLEKGIFNTGIETVSIETVNDTDYIQIYNISISLGGKLINYRKFYVGSEYGPMVPQILAEIELPNSYLMKNIALNESAGNAENITSLNLPLRIPHRTDNDTAPLSSPVALNAPWYTDAYDYTLIENPDGTQTLILKIYPYSFSNNRVIQNLSFDMDYNRKLETNLIKKPEGLGLNLISIPLNTTIKTASDIAKKIPGCEAVWHRVNGSYEGYPAVNNSDHFGDFNITPGVAYFVSVSENITWELIGEEKEQIAINLTGYFSGEGDKPAINLIEIPIDTNITTAEDLANAIPNCTEPGQKTVSMWDPINQEFIEHPSGYPLNNFEIIPGRGYIVSTCENITWVIQ